MSTADEIMGFVEEKGEVMVRTESGLEHELHPHNLEKDDPLDTGKEMLKVDADDEIHWLDPESVERYWIHKDF